MPYPEQINLPFNFSLIKDSFQFAHHPLAATAAPGSWVIIQGNSVVVCQNKEALQLPHGKLPDWLQPGGREIGIGNWNNEPLQIFSISSNLPLQEPFVSEPFNWAEQRLSPAILTIAGLAKQIMHWERQSRHCSRCGALTTALPDSYGKKCSACAAEHFPHIHPCAIVLVKRGNELLLTRKPDWTPGRYSLVAGFLDFGESLEECAIREVKEETGINICNVRYVGSQNWPFPAQLMAGFVADYAGGEINVDTNELEDARWFPHDALPDLPAARSIARWIIDSFG